MLKHSTEKDLGGLGSFSLCVVPFIQWDSFILLLVILYINKIKKKIMVNFCLKMVD